MDDLISTPEATAEMASAAASFFLSGVTHVLFVPSAGLLPYRFLQVTPPAVRPRLGLTSLDLPAAATSRAIPGALDGANAVGWLPAHDMGPAQLPPDHPTELCSEITGQPASVVAPLCDGLFFLKAACDTGTVGSRSDLRDAVGSLGGSFRSRWTFETVFGTGRHDGAAAWRPLAYDDGCLCWRYSGDSRPIP